jgi:hypothetical protein
MTQLSHSRSTGQDSQLKTRREEDGARSERNGMTTEDSPKHHNADHLVESADARVSKGLPEPLSCGRDDEGDYRKLHATPAKVM